MPEPTVICLAFLDDGTDLEDFAEVTDGGGFRARVTSESGASPVEDLLSGGAGLDAFNVFEMLVEDRIPYVSVNTPARAHPRDHVGTALGPGLDAPPDAQRQALETAAGKPWRFLFAALRGPFEWSDMEDTLTALTRAGETDNPYVMLLHLPEEGDGSLLMNGPGVEWRNPDEAEEAAIPDVTATLLTLAESHLVPAVDGHPLPVLKADVAAARRQYVSR